MARKPSKTVLARRRQNKAIRRATIRLEQAARRYFEWDNRMETDANRASKISARESLYGAALKFARTIDGEEDAIVEVLNSPMV